MSTSAPKRSFLLGWSEHGCQWSQGFLCGLCPNQCSRTVFPNRQSVGGKKSVDCLIGTWEGAKMWTICASLRTRLGSTVLGYFLISGVKCPAITEVSHEPPTEGYKALHLLDCLWHGLIKKPHAPCYPSSLLPPGVEHNEGAALSSHGTHTFQPPCTHHCHWNGRTCLTWSRC